MSTQQPGDRVSYIGESRDDQAARAAARSDAPPPKPPAPKQLTTSEDLSPAFLMSAVFIALVILIYHFLPATT